MKIDRETESARDSLFYQCGWILYNITKNAFATLQNKGAISVIRKTTLKNNEKNAHEKYPIHQKCFHISAHDSAARACVSTKSYSVSHSFLFIFSCSALSPLFSLYFKWVLNVFGEGILSSSFHNFFSFFFFTRCRRVMCFCYCCCGSFRFCYLFQIFKKNSELNV